MLRYLSIRNLAVIEAVDVEFENGLNVLTGETGAGKSMLVGAVSLLLGGRASPEMVRTGCEAAAIQAIFERGDGTEVHVRRDVTAQGRSRAFIDGALATAAALKDLGTELVDLHGQHDHQALLDPSTHLDLLDEFAGAAALRSEILARYDTMAALVARQAALIGQAGDRQRRLDLVRYQLDEIERTAPARGEDEDLQTERRVLSNAERLRRLCEESYAILYDSDTAVLGGLSQVFKRVAELAAVDGTFGPYAALREHITPSLDEMARVLRSYAASIDQSPERLQQVEDRLAAIERLKRKYGPALADVLATADRLRTEAASLDSLDEQLGAIAAQLAAARDAYLALARRLSAARQSAAGRLAQRLERELADLAMPRTRVAFRFERTADAPGEDHWTPRGADEGEIFVSPNPGEDLRPLARIASGGEISRVMLALKTIASTDRAGKSLVFDEVDVGIGGLAASVVGSRLRQLSERFQVLCITHLPQIAAHGGTHLVISKEVRAERTSTTVRTLSDPSDRIAELARMIGGGSDAPGARASALELLEQAKGEQNTKATRDISQAKAKVHSHRPRRPDR